MNVFLEEFLGFGAENNSGSLEGLVFDLLADEKMQLSSLGIQPEISWLLNLWSG
jgi:hypothetical protein